ncbi:MAG TPA: hypothetical protein VFB26_08000, partial [Gaiellaceae bacterium]|nr:hypothetical protein [Gaiellaceae bacterium]
MTGRPWLVLEGRDRQAVLRNGPVLVLDRRVRARIGPDLLAETADPELLAARVRRGAPGMLLGEALLDQ